MDKCARKRDEEAAGYSAKVPVKRERASDEEIKEYAETAMNELLGWYGYANQNKDQKTKAASWKSQSNSNSSGPDSPKYTEGCGWCGKSVDDSNGLSSGTATFCSELCFSQSRRANFKKNKTCDWCRHVRHTVSYVDFQDGASQLQFCSDKCLNQYKMHIFCRETRAHLEMHPHLASENSTAGLITPDLWMKNCKSPASRTPSPTAEDNQPQTSPLPLITVAHPSKLLASPPERQEKIPRCKPVKRIRKRPPSTITNYAKISELPQDLRIRHSPVQPEPPERIRTDFFQPQPFPPNPVQPLRPINNLLPPVTIMVPYPVMVPIPVPIPIPLPLSDFVKASEAKSCNVSSQEQESSHKDEEEEDELEIIVDDVKSSPTAPIRPLRKRKRVVEPKTIKTKKPLPV